MYIIIWLNLQVSKMKEILCCSHDKKFSFWSDNKSFIHQPCLVKTAGHWPCSFLGFTDLNIVSIHKNTKKTWPTFGHLDQTTGFVPVFKQKIQGLFKDFQGHISHISETLFNSKRALILCLFLVLPQHR